MNVYNSSRKKTFFFHQGRSGNASSKCLSPRAWANSSCSVKGKLEIIAETLNGRQKGAFGGEGCAFEPYQAVTSAWKLEVNQVGAPRTDSETCLLLTVRTRSVNV